MKSKATSAILTSLIAVCFLIVMFLVMKSAAEAPAEVVSDVPFVSEATIDSGSVAATPVGTYSNGSARLIITDEAAGFIKIMGNTSFGNTFEATEEAAEAHTSRLEITLPIENNIATYTTQNEDGSQCVLEFSFAGNSLRLRQKMECDVPLASFAKGSEESLYTKE